MQPSGRDGEPTASGGRVTEPEGSTGQTTPTGAGGLLSAASEEGPLRGRGNLCVIDGDTASPTYGTLLAGQEIGSTTFGVVVDEVNGLVIVTRNSDGFARILRDARP